MLVTFRLQTYRSRPQRLKVAHKEASRAAFFEQGLRAGPTTYIPSRKKNPISNASCACTILISGKK